MECSLSLAQQSSSIPRKRKFSLQFVAAQNEYQDDDGDTIMDESLHMDDDTTPASIHPVQAATAAATEYNHRDQQHQPKRRRLSNHPHNPNAPSPVTITSFQQQINFHRDEDESTDDSTPSIIIPLTTPPPPPTILQSMQMVWPYFASAAYNVHLPPSPPLDSSPDEE